MFTKSGASCTVWHGALCFDLRTSFSMRLSQTGSCRRTEGREIPGPIDPFRVVFFQIAGPVCRSKGGVVVAGTELLVGDLPAQLMSAYQEVGECRSRTPKPDRPLSLCSAATRRRTERRLVDAVSAELVEGGKPILLVSVHFFFTPAMFWKWRAPTASPGFSWRGPCRRQREGKLVEGKSIGGL